MGLSSLSRAVALAQDVGITKVCLAFVNLLGQSVNDFSKYPKLAQ
jgi:hypothetical protein